MLSGLYYFLIEKFIIGVKMSFQQVIKSQPEPDEVIFFTEKNFLGDKYSSIIGDNIQVPRALNDKLYSVRVGSAVKLVLIRDYGFSGPTQEIESDLASISLGGPGSGLSCFIVLQKADQYIARFSFVDEVSNDRSLTLISSNFNPTGEVPNQGVTIPNPNIVLDENKNNPRVFSILNEINDINLPVTVGLYIRRADGVYENIDALILVYLTEIGGSKVIVAKDFPDYSYGRLTFSSDDNKINFVWNKLIKKN